MGADLLTPGTRRDTSKSGSPRSTGSDSKDDGERGNVNPGTRLVRGGSSARAPCLKTLAVSAVTSLLHDRYPIVVHLLNAA